MKRIVLYLVLAVIFSHSFVWGQIVQTVEISSSPNPVGSGARALGMGGAFIGVADDATAASWNPGGLIQLESPEFSIVGAYNRRTEDTTYVAFPEASGPQTVSTYDLNYLSFAYPFAALNRNMIVSLNFQHLYDFNKQVNYSYSLEDTTVPPLSLQDNVEWMQEGDFKAISPAFAVQLTPSLSLGLTLNLWENGLYDNYWESEYRSQGSGTLAGFPFNFQTRIDEKYKMDGLRVDLFDPSGWQNINFNLGLMWNINSMFTLGAVFKSPFEARLRHDFHFESTITCPTNPGSNSQNVIQRSEMVTLDMPMSYGIGLSVRLSDALTLDLDVYRTNWSDYVLHDAEGNELNPITGKFQRDSDIDDTTQVRFGGEYLFIRENMVIPLRAGVFYDPEPAEGSPDDFWGLSIGSGIAYKKFIYDIAYQYRFGRDVRTTTVGSENSSQDVDQHTVYMSVIYHF
jgi:long-subunit fatty acid transport protein